MAFLVRRFLQTDLMRGLLPWVVSARPPSTRQPDEGGCEEIAVALDRRRACFETAAHRRRRQHRAAPCDGRPSRHEVFFLMPSNDLPHPEEAAPNLGGSDKGEVSKGRPSRRTHDGHAAAPARFLHGPSKAGAHGAASWVLGEGPWPRATEGEADRDSRCTSAT